MTRKWQFGIFFAISCATATEKLRSESPCHKRIGIEWLKEFQEPGTAAPRRSQRKKRTRQTKSEATERSWESLVRKHQPSIKRQQSAVIAQLGDVGRATHHRNDADALRHRPSQGISVGRAARDTERAKFFQFQKIRQLRNKRRPIEQFALDHKTRIGNSRPVRRNNSHSQFAGGVVGKLRHQTRAWPTMTKHDRLSTCIAIFAERDPLAVLADKNFVPQRNHWHIMLTGLFCRDAN